MRRPTALVLRGDARSLPLPDESVDLIVTSPPYYALRSYSDGGEHYAGQVGSEPTPAEYIAALIQCTAEWVRVLKPTGSIFINLGDKYNSAASGQNLIGIDERAVGHGRGRDAKRYDGGRGQVVSGIRAKSLMLLPERYRIACVDQLGLIARAVICWHKPNGLPESVTDRVRRSHEDWVHLTKRPRYYAAVDEIREPHTEPNGRPGYSRQRPPAPGGNRGLHVGRMDHAAHRDMGQSPLGKLPGSVWSIPSEPLRVPEHLGVDHFAAFPLAWPLRLIVGWSPPGICTVCGEGRRPEVLRERAVGTDFSGAIWGRNGKHSNWTGRQHLERSEHRVTGYACACPEPTAPTRPSVVVDPFGGTGTTALAARALGRIGVTVDRSADYCRLAQWRTTDPGELAKALRVEKPAPQLDGQPSLFDLAEVSP